MKFTFHTTSRKELSLLFLLIHFQCTAYTGSYSANTYCKRGMQQTLLFQTSRTYRSVKLTVSRRSLNAVVRSPCQGVTMTLTTIIRMCIYINECSASLYPIVIENIIKSDIYSLFIFVLKYDKNEIFFN